MLTSWRYGCCSREELVHLVEYVLKAKGRYFSTCSGQNEVRQMSDINGANCSFPRSVRNENFNEYEIRKQW